MMHHLLSRHIYMEKDDAVIVLCGRRWSRKVSVWFLAAPGMLWEETDDLEGLLVRLGFSPAGEAGEVSGPDVPIPEAREQADARGLVGGADELGADQGAGAGEVIP